MKQFVSREAARAIETPQHGAAARRKFVFGTLLLLLAVLLCLNLLHFLPVTVQAGSKALPNRGSFLWTNRPEHTSCTWTGAARNDLDSRRRILHGRARCSRHEHGRHASHRETRGPSIASTLTASSWIRRT